MSSVGANELASSITINDRKLHAGTVDQDLNCCMDAECRKYQHFVRYLCFKSLLHSLNVKCVYACMHTKPLHHSCMS